MVPSIGFVSYTPRFAVDVVSDRAADRLRSPPDPLWHFPLCCLSPGSVRARYEQYGHENFRSGL